MPVLLSYHWQLFENQLSVSWFESLLLKGRDDGSGGENKAAEVEQVLQE